MTRAIQETLRRWLARPFPPAFATLSLGFALAVCSTVLAVVAALFAQSLPVPAPETLFEIVGDARGLRPTPLVVPFSVYQEVANRLDARVIRGVAGAAPLLGAVSFNQESIMRTRVLFRVVGCALSAVALVPAVAEVRVSAGRALSVEAYPIARQGADVAGREEFLKWYAAQNRFNVPVERGKAMVVVVEFMDFQCATCRLADEMLRPLLADFGASHPGQVALVVKHFPLDPLCNPAAATGRHVSACESAAAFEMARKQGAGAAMESFLYGHLEELTPTLVRAGVRQVLGITDFDQRYKNVIGNIERDIALGRTLEVNAVPTLFVNGVRLRGGAPREFLRAAIQLELARR
jgi:hypothetical protein